MEKKPIRMRFYLVDGYAYGGPLEEENEHFYIIFDEKSGRRVGINKTRVSSYEVMS